MALKIIVLAAGSGRRMKSSKPKVMHEIAGTPMISHVLKAVSPLSREKTLLVYNESQKTMQYFLDEFNVEWVLQKEQLGTGHAVMQTLPFLNDEDIVLITFGDIPLIRSETLKSIVRSGEKNGFCILSVVLDEPQGYGRLVRDSDGLLREIIESSDLRPSSRNLRECNTGIFSLKASYLKKWLPKLSNDNAQGEFYLTDCIAMAVDEGVKIATESIVDVNEVLGVNTRVDLAKVERTYQQRVAADLMESGVTLLDPNRIDVRGRLMCGKDVIIDINNVFIGDVSIDNDAYIGANNVIVNTHIGKNVTIKENCVLDSVQIQSDCKIGPFSRLRPGTKLEKKAVVGNFVEIKESSVGPNSKISHLSYIGDAELGEEVNVGAGTITCNYDGARKHRTVLKDRAFIGSNSELVAPVEVGVNATVGAGSTITKNVNDNELVTTRSKRKLVPDWKRPKK